MNQLVQFDGKLYEQIDSVAMGSPPTGCTHSKRIFVLSKRNYIKTTRSLNFTEGTLMTRLLR